LGVFALVFLIVLRTLKNFIMLIKSKLKQASYIYQITICDGEIKEDIVAFYDTGNNIKNGGVGVNIISLNLFLKLHKDIDLHKVLMGKIDNSILKEVKYIDIQGIGKTQKFLSYNVDFFEIEGLKFENARVAVAMKNFGEYDCILHKDFLRGVYE
jgi:hypothetical protein